MIRIYCEAADAVLKETQTLTAGMINYPEVLLTFSDAWDGYGKAVVVKAGEVEETALIVNSKFVVPAECLAESGVNLIVGISGSDGVHTIPTIWCSCGEIMDSVDINDSTMDYPATPSLVEQMLGYAEDVVEEAQTLQNYIIENVAVDDTNAGNWGVTDVSIADTGAGENRTLTFTFTNLKGKGIKAVLFTASGENKGRIQIKLDDDSVTNYDGVKEAIAAMDALVTSVTNAESSRATAETARANAETLRDSAETERVTAEQSRATAEESRQNAEGLRDSNEGVRVANEAQRQTNENTRMSNENARVSAETSRSSEFEGWREDYAVTSLKSEGYAVGEQNGAAVTSGSPYYQNNAKYYATRCVTAETTAQNAANSASSSASSASTSASTAQSAATNAQNRSNEADAYAGEAAASASTASQAATNAAASATLAAQHVYNVSVEDTTLTVTSAQYGFIISVVGTTVTFTDNT